MTVAVPADQGIVLRPLTRVQYDALVSTGKLDDEPVELLEGAMVEMPPEGPFHGGLHRRLTNYLIRRLPDDLEVSPASPFAASALSQPEPDLAVVPVGTPHDQHPAEALLVVELSFSSLAKDLGPKARIYGQAGVPVYWVIDLRRRQVHVHTEPGPDGYGRVEVLSLETPLEVGGVTVMLADLLD